MAFDVVTVMGQLTSAAAALGVFDQVTGHEPKAAPSRTGLTCAVWVQEMRPVGPASGLASASLRVEFQARIFTSMLSEPQDDIDPRITKAADALLSALIGGFTLAGNVRQVDVFGGDGEGLRATAGYLTQDGTVFRVMDVSIPVILTNVYTEVA